MLACKNFSVYRLNRGFCPGWWLVALATCVAALGQPKSGLIQSPHVGQPLRMSLHVQPGSHWLLAGLAPDWVLIKNNYPVQIHNLLLYNLQLRRTVGGQQLDRPQQQNRLAPTPRWCISLFTQSVSQFSTHYHFTYRVLASLVVISQVC